MITKKESHFPIERQIKRILYLKQSTTTPLNELVKNIIPSFLDRKLEQAFQSKQNELSNANVLALSNISKTFELEYFACGLGVGAVLLKGGHPIASLKITTFGATFNYPTYN